VDLARARSGRALSNTIEFLLSILKPGGLMRRAPPEFQNKVIRAPVDVVELF